MLKRFLYIPLLLATLIASGQQTTTFSGVVGFTDDGSGNFTSTTSGWNQNMLTSSNFIAGNTDGSVSYTINNTTDKFAIGLSIATPSIKTKDITYRMLGGKKLHIWENNKHKGNYGNLAIGDVLEIARVDDQILFKKNGNTLLSLSTDPSLVLYVKIQTQATSMTIASDEVTGDYYEDMVIGQHVTHETCLANNIGAIDISVSKGLPPFTFSWSNGATVEDLIDLAAGNYTVTVNDAANQQVTKTFTVQKEIVWTDPSAAGSVSKNQLLADENGNVSYDVDQTGFSKIVGLSEIGNGLPENQMNYGIQLNADGTIAIYELGNVVTGDFGNYELDDIIKIERTGSDITYYRNDEILRTIATDPTELMQAKYFLADVGATLNNVNVSFCDIPLEVSYTTVLVSQHVLGGISLSPIYGTPPYTILWEDGSTDQDRTNLASGIYNVSVSDANSQQVDLKIVVGMELEFAHVTGLDVINNEEIVKTAPDGYGEGITTLNNLVDGDGEIRIEITELNKEFTFGLREENNPQAITHTDMSFGIYVDDANNLSSYDNNTLTNLGTVNIGDIISIEKVEANIYYKKNDVVLGEGFIQMAHDTAIGDTTVGDTAIQVPGVVVGIDGSTSTIMSLVDGVECACNEPLPSAVVVGSTVGFEQDASTNTATNVDFPIPYPTPVPAPGGEVPGVQLCDVPKIPLPLFKIDFSLFSSQLRIANIKVIKFSVIPEISADISHDVCSDPGNASIDVSVKGGVPPYTYSWVGPNSFTSTEANIAELGVGDYTLTITDGWTIPHVVTKTFEVGYSAVVTNVSGCRCSNPDEQTPSSTNKDNSSVSRSELCVGATSEGCAESMNRLVPNEDGGISYVVDQVGYTKTFGLSNADAIIVEPVPGSTGVVESYIPADPTNPDPAAALSHGTILQDADGSIIEFIGDLPIGMGVGSIIEYDIDDNVIPNLAINLREPGTVIPTTPVIDYAVQLMNDGSISILEQGNQVPGNYGFFKLGDVIKVERLGSEIIYTNSGVVLKTTTTDPTQKLVSRFILDETCASFNNLYTDFCNLKLSADYIVVNESSSGLGSIVLEPKDGVAPYYYFWEDGDQSKERYGLESGIYDVCIVDTIQDTTKLKILVGAELSYANVVDVIVDQDEFTNGESGLGLVTINNIVEGDGEIFMQFEENPLAYGLGPGSMTFGLREINDVQATGFDQMRFAMYTDDLGNLFAFDQGVSIELGAYAGAGDELSIEKLGDQIIYKKNGYALRTVEDLSQDRYAIDVVMFTPSMRVVAVRSIRWRFWPRITSVITNKTQCLGPNNGAIDLTLTGGFGPFTYSWSNGATTQDISNLAPGVYTVQITDSWFFPQTFTRTFYVGTNINWANVQNASTTGSSIVKSASPPTGWGTGGGSSQNQLFDDVDGWMAFKVPTFVGALNYVAIGLSDQDNNTNITDIDYGISFFTIDVILPNYTFQYHRFWIIQGGLPVSPQMSFNSTDDFRIEYLHTTSTINYYKNNQLVYSTSSIPTPSTGHFVADVALYTVNSTIEDIRVSFPCKEPFIYGHLRKKMDGGIYKVVNDKVYIKYREEYTNDNTFKFNIYDNETGTKVADNTNTLFSIFNGYGDNRIDIGMSSLPQGYYTLEVINDKNEKWYLRIDNKL